MYLKRIEIKGFKSFAVHTEMAFVPGITAVVGPNGSGKSNVSDAIRWVLGEQSARTLRGGKMEDVIFAGSDSRHAVNFCEVSLTLDNSDGELPISFSEVTVTRRLYRSGDSEYYLNRQPCRLKDIAELLMDTGLGKEAYSIIGQGRIDEILSTKAEDRRGIFEEAAGIVKFKVRKGESERKLDETEQNLARLNDIIFELKEQVGPLSEQAEKAKTYRELREQLKQCEVGLYVYNIASVHKEWEHAGEQLQQLEEAQLAAETALKQKELEMEQQKWQLEQLDRQVEEKQQQLLKTSEAVEKAEGQHDVLLERERSQRAEQKRLLEQREHLNNRLAHVNDDLSKVEERLKAKKDDIAQTSEALQQREHRLERLAARAEEQLEDVKSDLIELMGEAASLKNDLRHLDQQEQQLRERRESLERERKETEQHVNRIRRELTSLEELQQRKAKELQACADEYRTVAEKRELVSTKESHLTEQLQKLGQTLNSLSSRRDVLKEWEADFSGFFQGVKEVLKARERGKLDGIEGAVAELLTVPQDLETAVETALGGAMQHIVVESEQYARAAIDYLKRQRLGRATFLPMDVIRGRRLTVQELNSVKRDSGFVGIGQELVQFDGRYENIVSSLLGNVVIARKLADANRIARLLRYRYRVVTLDGDLVNPGGSMSGGSAQKRSHNLLGRKRELESLEKKIEALQREKHKLEKDVEKYHREKDRIENQLEKVRSQGETLRLEEQKLSSQLEHKRSEWEHSVERLERLKGEGSRAEAEADRFRQKRADIEARIEANTEKAQKLNAERERLEQVFAAEKQEKEAETGHVTELKVKLAKHLQEQEHLLENVQRLENEKKTVEEELRVLAERVVELEELYSENDAEKASYAQKIRTLREERENIRTELEELRRKRSKRQSELNESDAVFRQHRQTLQEAETKRHKQEVVVNRLDVELNNLLNALGEQYEISYERAKERYCVPDDPKAAETKVKQLKERIAALGEVNLGAVEEYERVSERLAFLEAQQQDLLEAKAALYQVIDDMDREMAERFGTTFQAIRQQFQTVFAELFGGGRADLRLTDPDALLETGVDIVAQPPGKKLQHLSLLSGGERTLTAIALLFAILRVKPVPFCVLDEVEAALDEANVVHFARYLRQFSKETQFIVITHRKGTMEAADVLYGVTMQESGVSKLVSVKLEGGAEEVAAAAE